VNKVPEPFTKQYSKISAEDCFYIMLESHSYHSIYQQLSHPRWDKYKDGCDSWREVACKVIKSSNYRERKEDFWVGILFAIGWYRAVHEDQPEDNRKPN
jgi:hypothetical protein